MTRKCQGFSVVSTPGPRLCVALALVFIFHLLWTEGPTQPRPLWGSWSSYTPGPWMVWAEPHAQRGGLCPCSLQTLHRSPGCWQLLSYGLSPSLCTGCSLCKNTLLSSSWPFKTSPIHCKELKHEGCLQQEAFTPSQVWVHGVCGPGGLSSIAQLPTHSRYSLNVRINK